MNTIAPVTAQTSPPTDYNSYYRSIITNKVIDDSKTDSKPKVIPSYITKNSDLAYICNTTTEISEIALDLTKGLRTTYNAISEIAGLSIHQKPKDAILSLIDIGSIKNRKSIVFIVFQTRIMINQDSISSNNNNKYTFRLSSIKDFDTYPDTIVLLESVRAVVEIEKVESRRCKASNIVSTTNDTITSIPSISYEFNIHVHKGNPDGYAVFALLKNLGFDPSAQEDVISTKSSLMNSLIWCGEHKAHLEQEKIAISDLVVTGTKSITMKNPIIRRMHRPSIK